RPQPVREPDLRVAPVAERLVAGGAAPAEGHAVPRLVAEAVRGFDRDAATDPEPPGDALGRVLHEADRGLELRLVRLLRLPVPGDQPSRGAPRGLPDGEGLRLLVVDLHQVPHLAAVVAEPGERTERLGVGEN